jgi:hypothetical protein
MVRRVPLGSPYAGLAIRRAMASTGNDADLALDFIAVRRAIGIVGGLLPLVLLVGGTLVFRLGLEPSISHYHGTGMRNVFVGLLSAVGVFLLSYRGYGARDWFAGQFAGSFALLVAVFPNTGKTTAVHFTAAALFFVILALTSLLLFTRSSESKEDQPNGKRRRNVVYIVCGWGILGCVALIAAYNLFLEGRSSGLDSAGPVFWLEALAIWFFALSWLVKGDALESALAPRKVREFFAEGG